MVKLTGKVKIFNDIHGNGIIEPDKGRELWKFSFKDIKKKGLKMPNEGQHVDFEVVMTDKGPRTRNIILK
jgi:cold shock protein